MRRVLLLSPLLVSLVVLFAAVLSPVHAGTGPGAAAPTIAPPHQARIDAAKKAYVLYATQQTSGAARPDDVYQWSRHWYEAERDAGVKTAGADHLARMQKLETLVGAAASSGLVSGAEVAATKFYVAEAQLWK